MTAGASSGAGVDFSPAMLAAAKGKPAARGRVVQADCRAIPFANAVFDLVVCSFAVGHFPDLRRAAREVTRVAAAGADVFVSDLHPLAYAKGWRTGFRDDQGAVDIANSPRSAQELVAAWLSAGFQCVQSAECRLGEPERAIFARAGRAHLFNDACRIPGILILHFQRPEQIISRHHSIDLLDSSQHNQ